MSGNLVVIEKSELVQLIEAAVKRAVSSVNPSDGTPNKYLDAQGAAEFLGISRNNVYVLTRAGKLPFKTIGTIKRYDPNQLKEFQFDSKQDLNERFEQELRNRKARLRK